jgi:hypothetical protein
MLKTFEVVVGEKRIRLYADFDSCGCKVYEGCGLFIVGLPRLLNERDRKNLCKEIPSYYGGEKIRYLQDKILDLRSEVDAWKRALKERKWKEVDYSDVERVWKKNM